MRGKTLIQWRTQMGDKTTIGDMTVTPQSQAFTLRLPFWGFVWNRPVAVLVEEGGRVERVPIVDVTRNTILALLGLGVLFSAMVFVRNRLRN